MDLFDRLFFSEEIIINGLDSKIRKNEEKELLLRKKCIMLEENIAQAQETLSTVKGLTPVEPDENPDTSSIKETLQACSKKLESSLKQIPAPTNNIKNTTNMLLMRSGKKPQTPKMNLETCFALSERQSVWRSARKLSSHGKEDNRNIINLPKQLFPVVENKNGGSNDSMNESLGIVNIENYDFNSGDTMHEKYKSTPNLAVEQSAVLHSLKPSVTVKPADIVSKNEVVKGDLKKLLQTHNSATIWNVFQGIENDIHSTIMRKLSAGFTLEYSHEKYRDDLAQLHFIHIQTELQHLNNKMALKKLEHSVKQRKEELCTMLSQTELSNRKFEQLLATFDAHVENIALEAKLQVLNNEIHSAKQLEGDDKQLQLLPAEVKQVKKDIVIKMNNIEHYIQLMGNVFQHKAQIIKKASSRVKELLPYFEDMSWCDRLTKNLNHLELETFQQYPYGYNRRCTNTNPSLYYKDLCTSYVPEDLELDSETMYMFAEILESPFSTPEAVLLNIIKSKRQLESLKAIRDRVQIPQFEHHTLESLEKQSSYIEYALDKLHHLLTSRLWQQTHSMAETARESFDIWLEMPFKELFVSKSLVDGKDYMYYKKQYDDFFNHLV
ncbi:unnamed protein product [Acanthoscelides obtectus]|uniref:Uncharacterized protein n=1 Tax=Acanthoscelides obtectus TaxID=200917 RepID=A0A9P0P8T0_ACAOB|nr:unnamed protein product [Acanthoscelides obtectus]CAK1664757.1 hypothetical protein AOBTE_LOCUS24450 [Acanthoscelides obtectus]